MNASNKLCKELVATYSDFSKIKDKEFVGYKLVDKKNLNYYSIVSGMFRYKERRISNNSYSELYRRTENLYNENLNDRLAVFKNEEDAINFLIEYKNIEDPKYKTKLVLLELTISEGLEKAKCSNKFCKNCDVVIGGVIEKVKEIKKVN